MAQQTHLLSWPPDMKSQDVTTLLYSLFAGLGIIWVCAIVIQRIFFSPLSGIPGPLIAAVTGAWIWALDIKGTSVATVFKLHQKHGKIVRIGPRDVSIQDAELYTNVIYKLGSHFQKSSDYYEVFAVEGHNSFSTSDPTAHSYYRRQVSGQFARKNILLFESIMWDNTYILLKQLASSAAQNRPVDLVKMGRSYALDAISKFFYGVSEDALLKPDFEEPLLDVIEGFSPINHFFMMFPRLQKIVLSVVLLLPFKYCQVIPTLERRVIEAVRRSQSKQHQFKPLLESQVETARKRGLEVSPREIASNGVGGIVAGTDTTGIAISVGLWSIYNDEDVRQRLHKDLTSIWSDENRHPTLQDLEALPFLRACVQESLRYSSPVSGRLPRVVPESGLDVAGHYLPPSTRVSSSSYLVHFDKDVFENPDAFDPDRWLKGAPEKYLVPFSTGSRACSGINLAMAEIFIALAAVIRWYKAVDTLGTEYKFLTTFTTYFPHGLKVKLAKISA